MLAITFIFCIFMISFFIVLVIVNFVWMIYIDLSWDRNYWKKRGVSGPGSSISGSEFYGSFNPELNMIYKINEFYRRYKHKTPFVGVYRGRTPQLLIIDSRMVKDVLINDFKNFEDSESTSVVDKKRDSLLGRHPFLLTGNEWREKRAELTPAFTVSRMRAMYPIIDNACVRVTEFVRKGPADINGFEANELSAKFTTELASNLIYGFDSKSFAEDKSVMFTMGQSIQNLADSSGFHLILIRNFPLIGRLWKQAIIPKKTEDFFMKLAMDSVKMREKGTIRQEDFMNFLLNLRNKKNLSDIDIAAHAFTLFKGVIDSSTVLSFTMYFLGRNKKIQDKLRMELMKNVGDDGRFSFEKITEMRYLDQVLNESLRLVPPLGFNTRICKNETQLTDYRGKKLTVEKGMILLIPYYSIHHDPDIYVQPEKFQPERFDESCGGITKYDRNATFLSFGGGPRKCIGMRFAYLQIKAALAEVVKNFEISVNLKTIEPLEFDPAQDVLLNTGGIWLNFKPL